MSDFVQHNASELSFNTCDSWVILTPIEQSIKSKIEAVGIPLKDWDIEINYGIKTGFNDAFIIPTETRDAILSNCADDEERKRTEELIRPILRGRDIKRYGYEWANLWLIWIPWHFPYHLDMSIKGASEKAEAEFRRQYSSVYQHLLQYKEQLSARNKAETGIRYEWYALQRWGANYWDDFSKPKIVYREISTDMEACIVPPNWMINNKLYMITAEQPSQLEYLCAFLNTKLFSKIILSSANFGGGKGTDFMGLVCLPKLESSIGFNELNLDARELFFCKLYHLSEDEYKFIVSQ